MKKDKWDYIHWLTMVFIAGYAAIRIASFFPGYGIHAGFLCGAYRCWMLSVNQ